MTKNFDYRLVLRRKLLTKQKTNPAFSLRAFARELSISPQLLSYVINGKRKLPLHYVDKIIDKLALPVNEEQLFRLSIKQERQTLAELDRISPQQQNLVNEQINYNLIVEWEYYAVITLLETSQSFSTAEQIADQLKMDKTLVESILNELEHIRYIEKSEGIYRVLTDELNTTWNIPSRTLRQAQKNNLDLAKRKIDEVPIEERLFCSSTIPIDSEQVGEVKHLIQEFQNKLSSLVRQTPGDSVFQFNVQFFSLTKIKENKSGKEKSYESNNTNL